MLMLDKGEETFFDAAESFSSEYFAIREESVPESLSFSIWLNELRSVKERRDKFLMSMSFTEVSSSNDFAVDESKIMGADRIDEWGGAVNSSCTSSIGENLASDCRESNGEANCRVEESGQEWSEDFSTWTEGEATESTSTGEFEHGQMRSQVEGRKNVDVKKKKMKGWLRGSIHKLKACRDTDVLKEQNVLNEAGNVTPIKVQQKKKKFMELTALYAGQEIKGHKGLISTMKFSPDGQYIASGGEDGIVRIWSISSVEAACSTSACNFRSDNMGCNSSFGKKKSMKASVVVPDQVFRINESPLHEFHGHTDEILDLAWSTSNHILSSSKDNTVRLWRVGSSKCLSVFLHNNYVTCIQFNPIDENYFISGSIDGKVRIWGLPEKRVVDWAYTRDLVTAICYQPNGKGFVAGFVSGICRFYDLHGTQPLLRAEIHIGGKRRSYSNSITGIQFLDNDSQRVMITSEDSKIRILDELDVVLKYQGLMKSGSQTSASFTRSGQHIVSIAKDSLVYLWNYDNQHIKSPKAKKSASSCEYFFSEGALVAIPWSGIGTDKTGAGNCSSCLQTHSHQNSFPVARDQDRFFLASWFSMDVSSKASVTWPEEKLPVCEVPYTGQSDQASNLFDNLPQQLQPKNNCQSCGSFSATWGTVIVTAGRDGKIRTFHNFGLPIKT